MGLAPRDAAGKEWGCVNERKTYEIAEENRIFSPSLVYYKDYIVENIKTILELAGGAERLWPHIKTHKCAEVIELIQGFGVNRFKAATIAEAELLGTCGAAEVILAYPLLGPNVERFMKLQKAFPDTRFWAIQEDFGCIETIAAASAEAGLTTNLMLDVNCGMDRTGVSMDQAAELYRKCSGLAGIHIGGLHCYDGHHHAPSKADRTADAAETAEQILKLRGEIMAGGLDAPIIVVGGTPSSVCYGAYLDFFVSPGTAFLNDYGYQQAIPDIPATPAGIVLGRVVSHPAEGLFTIDVGVKAIATDPAPIRGVIAGYEDAVDPVLQNEEHWVFRMREGTDRARPALGDVVYVIPSHICPTSALYPEAIVVEKGHVTGTWKIAARNRVLTI